MLKLSVHLIEVDSGETEAKENVVLDSAVMSYSSREKSSFGNDAA